MQLPDGSPCWSGDWYPPPATDAMWAQSAVARTVRALPDLHPWRLGDDKGSGRVLVWCAATGDPAHELAVLTQMAPPPDLASGHPDDERAALSPFGWDDALDILSAALPSSQRLVGVHRWVGGLARINGTWLPPVAILPRDRRGIDDPSTRWSTESLDFAHRYTVHSGDPRVAADLLAPHVMALILDRVPAGSAVTISGDAVHVWWEYDTRSRESLGSARHTAVVAGELCAAFPSFVLADHPNHADVVENRLDRRAADASAYRAARVPGRSQDPVLERIYEQARARYEAEHEHG